MTIYNPHPRTRSSIKWNQNLVKFAKRLKPPVEGFLSAKNVVFRFHSLPFFKLFYKFQAFFSPPFYSFSSFSTTYHSLTQPSVDILSAKAWYINENSNRRQPPTLPLSTCQRCQCTEAHTYNDTGSMPASPLPHLHIIYSGTLIHYWNTVYRIEWHPWNAISLIHFNRQ